MKDLKKILKCTVVLLVTQIKLIHWEIPGDLGTMPGKGKVWEVEKSQQRYNDIEATFHNYHFLKSY